MLDEPPHTLIQAAIDGFETQPDLLSLERIGSMQAQLADARAAALSSVQAQVSQLQDQLGVAADQLRALNAPSAAVAEALGGSAESSASGDVFKLLSSKSVELDTEKVALAKQLTELESAINHMSMQKIKLARQKQEAEQRKEQALAANVANNFNTTAMKIALFHKLGVHIEPSGGRDKVVIFDRAADAASLLEIDPKYSDYFISNYIWDRLGGARERREDGNSEGRKS